MLAAVAKLRAKEADLAARSASLTTAAVIKSNTVAGTLAHMQKLPPSTSRTTRAAVASVSPRLFKTSVAAQLLPKPRPLELKAVPVSLKDAHAIPVAGPIEGLDMLGLNNIDIDKLNSDDNEPSTHTAETRTMVLPVAQPLTGNTVSQGSMK